MIIPGYMKSIIYSPIGEIFADAEVEVKAREFLASTKQTIKVSTENFVLAVRVLIHEKMINHESVRFIFNNEELRPDKNGRLPEWPCGFCDTTENFLSRMLSEVKQMSKQPLTIIENYAFFFGQWPSNWELALMLIDGEQYNCVEQWMMAEKARVHNDFVTCYKILATNDPAEQKRLGRTVKNYNEVLWKGYREGIVLHGTLEKFRQNDELRKLLFDTGNLLFVEASPYDDIWGIGFSESAVRTQFNSNRTEFESGWGQNLLGKIITDARIILKKEYGIEDDS